MRRQVLVILILLFSLNLTAQQFRRDFERELSIGVTGGAGFSKLSFLHNDVFRMNELGDQSFRLGYRMGFVVRFVSQKHFGVQLETNYVRAGWTELFYEDSGVSMVNGYNLQDVKISRDLDYIEIPALSYIYFGQRKVRFFINVGFEVSILARYGEYKWNIADDDERKQAIKKDDPRLGEDYNKLDYGLVAGAGLDFYFGPIHALISGRYSYGFRDLYSNNKADVFQRSNNQLIGVNASILVPVLKYKEKKK